MLGKMLRKAKKNKGFTLIELIVVIAIIAILALILIPRFGGFRDSAQETADDATARTIHSAVAALVVSRDIIPTANGEFTVKDKTEISGATGVTPSEAEIEGHMQRLLGDDLEGTFKVEFDSDLNITVTH